MMQARRARWRALAATGAVLLALTAAPGAVAAQGDDDGRDGSDGFVNGTNDGRTATGTAATTIPGGPGRSAGGGGGDGGPNCTKSDGTRDYYWYEGLLYTTMEEQRTEIRPEEQRPGVYLHIHCGDEYVGFEFFPDGEPAPVDPVALARSVSITPPAPLLVTNPGAGDHLVEVEAWFWVENWEAVTAPPATAGNVTVNVAAQPSALVVDPGDGSPAFTCTGRPPAYDSSLPAEAQSSPCSHTYSRAGTFAATATLVYEVSFTSNVGVNQGLGTIEPSTTVDLAVREAQAIVVG
ncbi:MAG TPA: hypothetical protein VFZ30_01835 [Acidimicrobiales bacterium]